jgi:hypothetical protein
MPDVEKILRLVQEGVLTPDEAEEILAALDREKVSASGGHRSAESEQPGDERARHLRVEITEHGRQVVNLRVPINIASFAAGIVPGLPDDEAERIRETIRTGVRGPIVDINSEDGNRVLIVSE